MVPWGTGGYPSRMLYDFIRIHRDEILARARSRVSLRAAPVATYTEITNGIPHFLDQLTDSLRVKRERTDAIVASAVRHGNDLHRMGFTVTQVVHDYGDICQAVTELSEEFNTVISTEEFRFLNMCLDDAIAGAVTEFGRLREARDESVRSAELGGLAHELRNKLHAATLAHAAIKSGAVGVGGSTGAVLDRNLRAMRDLINRALAEVRIQAGIHHPERVVVLELIEEIESDAALEATERGVSFSVGPVGHEVAVMADRAVLAAAVINLLHNAFKFSKLGGHISLTLPVAGTRVFFAVQDQCGGLPVDEGKDLFEPFSQSGTDRTGVGLGLSISRKGIEAAGGKMTVVDLPGEGCIFTIDLPLLPPLAA